MLFPPASSQLAFAAGLGFAALSICAEPSTAINPSARPPTANTANCFLILFPLGCARVLNRIYLPCATENSSHLISSQQTAETAARFALLTKPLRNSKKGAKPEHCPGPSKQRDWFQGVFMPESRRRLLMTFVGAAGVLALRPALALCQGAPSVRPSPQPRPSPNAPDSHVPYGLKDGPQAAVSDKKAIERANQQELRSNVSKLYEIVADLKDQVEKTDANKTLSVSVVKKAQQIEKLAKQIKELAKG